MACSLLVSSLPGILQARILEWLAIPFSRRSSPPRDRAQVFCVSCIGSWILYHWSYLWNSNTLATWCEELTHWKRPWCWERLKVGGKRDNRGWDGWMASLTWWTWVWVSSGSWWWTGRPGVLQSMGSQRIGHDGVTQLNFFTTEPHGKPTL